MLSRLHAGLAALALLPAPALAGCDVDAAFNFMLAMEDAHWGPPKADTIPVVEGTGRRSIYTPDPGTTRVDLSFCTPYYCTDTYEVRTQTSHARLFHIMWGGSSFPDANESSVVLTDFRSGETCLVNHQGDTVYRDQAVSLAESLPRNL